MSKQHVLTANNASCARALALALAFALALALALVRSLAPALSLALSLALALAPAEEQGGAWACSSRFAKCSRTATTPR